MVLEKGPTDELLEKVGANSAVFYGPGGEWLGDYRKTNLFETDMTWAKAGTLQFPPQRQCVDPHDAQATASSLSPCPHHCTRSVLGYAWTSTHTHPQIGL